MENEEGVGRSDLQLGRRRGSRSQRRKEGGRGRVAMAMAV